MKENELPELSDLTGPEGLARLTRLTSLMALTLHQPWASFCAHKMKIVETRGWSTSYRGPIAIHAAATIPEYAREFCFEPEAASLLQVMHNYSDESPLSLLPKGKILAVAELYDCQPMTEPIRSPFGGPVWREWVTALSDQERALGHYDKGRYGLFLRNIVLLPEPVPCRGFQKLWGVPPLALACVRVQLEKAKGSGSCQGEQVDQVDNARSVAAILALDVNAADDVVDPLAIAASPGLLDAPETPSAPAASLEVVAKQSDSAAKATARTAPPKRDRLRPGEAPWPRLSESLPGPRHPDCCQKCGKTREQIDDAGLHLQAWQEHAQDEATRERTGSDPPEQIFLLLCTKCNREDGDGGNSGNSANGGRRVQGMIARHPRFYTQLPAFAPVPGIMAICGDCAWRDGTHCSSPLAKFNGGEGMEVRFPEGFTAHFLCNPRAASGFYTIYPGPAISCAGREEMEAAGARTGDGELVLPIALSLFEGDA